jgi:protein gp37
MGEFTGIAWTDSTINFWHGCTKVGPGCDFCYAESQDKRFGPSHWGSGVARKKIESAVAELRKLNRGHDKFLAEQGRRRRVFTQSMSDLFDNEVPVEWLKTAFEEIGHNLNLDFQIVTKRLSNVPKLVPAQWRRKWPSHVGLIVTVCNQAEAERDIPKLLNLKNLYRIPWVGVSAEPLLGPIDIYEATDGLAFGTVRLSLPPTAVNEIPDIGFTKDTQVGAVVQAMGGSWHDEKTGLDWVICGGESGPNRRTMKMEWAEDLRSQCADGKIPFFFKQDNGLRSGEKGRASDELWACKEFPA